MLKVYSIAPIVESAGITCAGYQAFLDQERAGAQDVTLIGRMLERGPSAIENEVDDALAVPDILRVGLEAQTEGASGVFIDCMLDPGLEALRCALNIPVVGAAETSFHAAATLGHRFGVVDVCDDTGPMVQAQIRRLGLASRFTGVRGTGLGVLEIPDDREFATRRVFEAARLAIVEDGADVIVLGCTAFSALVEALRTHLHDQGLDVPVIAPTALGLGVLIALIRCGLVHSKKSFPTPQQGKSLRGFELPQLYDRPPR